MAWVLLGLYLAGIVINALGDDHKSRIAGPVERSIVVKVEIPATEARRLMNPGAMALVTSSYRGKPNVMAAAWVTPLSHNPPLIGVALSLQSYTNEVIKKTEEFALNIPGKRLIEKVVYCGTTSGRETDKIAAAGLTPLKAKGIEAPLIEECLAHIECGVVAAHNCGDHTLFVGLVLSASVEEGAFEETWLLKEDEAKPLHHLGGNFFAVLEEFGEARRSNACAPCLYHSLEGLWISDRCLLPHVWHVFYL